MLKQFLFYPIAFCEANRRERRRALRHPGACTEDHRHGVIALPAAVDHANPSHCAIVFTSTSSSIHLQNTGEWCTEAGDRPPSSPTPIYRCRHCSSLLGLISIDSKGFYTKFHRRTDGLHVLIIWKYKRYLLKR